MRSDCADGIRTCQRHQPGAVAYHKGLLLDTRLLQDGLQGGQRVFEHMLGADVHLGDHKEHRHLQSQSNTHVLLAHANNAYTCNQLSRHKRLPGVLLTGHPQSLLFVSLLPDRFALAPMCVLAHVLVPNRMCMHATQVQLPDCTQRVCRVSA